jgi:hypothetical protein
MIFMGKPIAREISKYQQRKYRQANQACPHPHISHIKNLSAHTDRFRVMVPKTPTKMMYQFSNLWLTN